MNKVHASEIKGNEMATCMWWQTQHISINQDACLTSQGWLNAVGNVSLRPSDLFDLDGGLICKNFPNFPIYEEWRKGNLQSHEIKIHNI